MMILTEIEKSKEKQKELEAMKKAIWKEMDKITASFESMLWRG